MKVTTILQRCALLGFLAVTLAACDEGPACREGGIDSDTGEHVCYEHWT
ncbi:MAG: hypothetical protein ACR2PJ_07350 [Pseudomonadales bacterium]